MPQIPHHQLAHVSWQIPVDDLDISTHLITPVILGDELHRSIYNEQIAMSSLDCVAMPHAQYFRSSCWLFTA